MTGGSGTVGAHVVQRLHEQGHDVRVLSRRPGAGTHVGDLATGQGVTDAVRGATWIVHAASDTRRLGRQDVEQTRQLLRAAQGQVEHLLYVSIVGIDRVRYPYYRQKLRCEELVAAAPTPSTILRATQFHELLAMVLGAMERLPLAPVPSALRFQTVAAREVAIRLADLMAGPPTGRADDFGGPEVHTFGEMAASWRQRRGRPHRVVPLPLPGRVAAAVRQGHLTCPAHRDGRQTWAEFVAEQPLPVR